MNMAKIIKYLKPFILSIVLIIGLLLVQATSELALPDYTSKIVNVGIQQGGVENAVPEVIRKSELEKIKLFINDDEKNKIQESYILLDKENLSKSEYEESLKKYPRLEKEELYILDTKNEESIENLNDIMGKPMLVIAGIESGKMGISFDMISKMPKEQLEIMKSSASEKLKDMPKSMITQAAIESVKAEYAEIGLDTDKIQSRYILTTGGRMIALALLAMVATVIVSLLASRVAAGLGRILRRKVFQKVMSFSNVELDKFSIASLITRSTNDIQQVQTLMVMLLRLMFYAPILAIGGVIKVLKTDTSMGWIIGVAVGAIIVIMVTLFSLAIPRFKRVQNLVDKINQTARESLIGMLVVRAFNTQKYEESKFEKANKDLTQTNLFVGRLMTLMMPLMMLIMNLITVLIVWVGAHQADAGTIQVGDMMAFIQYSMQIIMSFLLITMVSVMYPRASVSAERIGEILETENSIKDIENIKSFTLDKKGYIEFNNVSFRYPNAEQNVLCNITFKAKPGEMTAFIGSTGSGKTTLINLIPRFYDVTDGEILIDGINVKEVSQSALRKKIGYVPQKGMLFSGTIESNIKYGDKDATEDKLEKIAEISQSIEFIRAKPEGFKSEISQGGTNISGGQKQRLSIARAIAKKPEIFIFDDSFSALDYKTDITLRRALKSETSESTVLIVAQRISTIINADNIIVLDQGRIVGSGTHKELMQNCEVYKQIASSQLSKEELS